MIGSPRGWSCGRTFSSKRTPPGGLQSPSERNDWVLKCCPVWRFRCGRNLEVPMRKVIFVLAASAASISLFPAPAASGVLSAIFGHIWELGAEEPLSKVPLVKPTPKLVPREPLRVPREAAPPVVSPIIGSEPVAGATTEGGASTAAGTSPLGHERFFGWRKSRGRVFDRRRNFD